MQTPTLTPTQQQHLAAIGMLQRDMAQEVMTQLAAMPTWKLEAFLAKAEGILSDQKRIEARVADTHFICIGLDVCVCEDCAGEPYGYSRRDIRKARMVLDIVPQLLAQRNESKPALAAA